METFVLVFNLVKSNSTSNLLGLFSMKANGCIKKIIDKGSVLDKG